MNEALIPRNPALEPRFLSSPFPIQNREALEPLPDEDEPAPDAEDPWQCVAQCNGWGY